jgi:uncharacterized membrane protein YphA (DoxX/SURF4 family)
VRHLNLGREAHEGTSSAPGAPTASRRTQARQITLLLLRVVAGLLFLQAGGMKMFDWFGGIPAELGGHPRFLSQIWIGGALEFYGGLAILLGLFTQPVAFILSGEMAVAYFQFHQPRAFGLSRTRASPPYCSASSSCFLRRTVQGNGASMP